MCTLDSAEIGERITCEHGDLLSQHLICFRRCKSTAESPAAPALANMPTSSCPAERRSVGVRHFLGHCNLRDPFYLNCWSVPSWWLVMDSISCWEGAEQFQYTPSNLSAFPFAGGPGGSSDVLSFSHLLVQEYCLPAQITLVTCD